MTTFSPNTVGSVATRRSTGLPPTVSDMRPSWGSRRSAMLMSAITLSRLITPAWIDFGECMTSWSTPSMRNRMRRSFSAGSTWMSDARSFTAWVISRLTNLTIGASSMISLTLGEVVAVAQLVGGLLRHRVDFAVETVEAVDRVLELTRGRDDRVDVGAGERADVVDREDVRRVAHRDDEPALVVPADRQRLVLAGEVLGDEAGDRRVDDALGEVDELEADLLGERADEVGLGDVAVLDQDATERLAARRLLGQGRVELRLW